MLDLKILKPGETGTGVMIESDAGFIDPKDKRNLQFITETQKLGEGKPIIAEPLILYVVLQKYGVQNRNGRIYPEHILKREANRYLELINERRALGECVPKGTGIYTKNGWRNIEDVEVNDIVFTLNINTNKLEWQPVTKIINKHYDDDMIRIYNNSSLDMLVTKKHQIVLWDRKDKPYILTAEELYDKINNNDSIVSHSYIKNSGEWLGDEPDYIRIPNSTHIIDTKTWAKFLGIFIAEGHCSGTKGGENNNCVIITQTKSETSKKIVELLDVLPFKYTISDNRQYIIRDKALHTFLFELGNSYEKHIPDYAKNWSVELLEILLEWLLLGDGRNRKDSKNNLMREYYTTSNKLSDDVFELFMKISNGATHNKRKQEDRYIYDFKNIEKEIINSDGTISLVNEKIKVKRLIKAENSRELNIISEKRNKGIYIDTRFTKAEKISFNDSVHCVTVDNGTWLMKYNNKISWTHNCDHPESSIIATDRVSHNITEIWWEGHTLMGKIEIAMSPGFVNYGIISCKGDQVANLLRLGYRIGVSSRGVGSLQEVNGKYIVQDDFEIICWDIVTSPSTPGSWIFNNKEAAKPFTESTLSKKNLLSDNLNKFLNN